jgi:hypothetical protein
LTLGLLGALALASAAAAHVTQSSGQFEVEMGWGNEPPIASSENFVEVGVARGGGAPVAVPAGALSVEVGFGEGGVTLPLAPTDDPGSLRADLTPTRPGTYGFHVTGTVEDQMLDVRATCSETTFECVKASAGTEFPVKDPSSGELAERLAREAARVEAASNQADSAKNTATLALAAAALALGLAAALSFVVAGRRKSSRP